MTKVDEKETPVITDEEKAGLFLAEYKELAEKYGFELEAIPLETPEAIIKQKLRVVRYAKPS